MTVPSLERKSDLWLFVYGTLRSACRNPEAERLLAETCERHSAKVQGRLFAIDWYPGMTLCEDQKNWVTGEIVQITSPTSWNWLDRYEGCHADDPKPHEYHRNSIICYFGEGFSRSLQAQTYVYQGDIRNRERVLSGDWLNR